MNSDRPVLVATEIKNFAMDHPILRFTPTGLESAKETTSPPRRSVYATPGVLTLAAG